MAAAQSPMGRDGEPSHTSAFQDVKEVPPTPKRPWLKKAMIAGVIFVVLGLGAMAGVLIHRATRPKSSSGATVAAEQLPPPGTPAAQALMADPNTPKAVKDLYQAAADAATLNPNTTKAFLQQLQAQLTSMGYDLDLSLFMDLANQVVDLLRRARAEVLLSLLRQYAATGSVSLEGVDSDALQREVKTVLQPGVWGVYFQQTGTRDHATGTIRSFQEYFADLLNKAGRPTPAPAPAPASAGRRLLLRPSKSQHSAYLTSSSGRDSSSIVPSGTLQQRRRRRLAAAAQIPEIPADAPGSSAGLPTAGPPQTVDDMLCGISRWAAVPQDTSSCPARPRRGPFQYGGVAFNPVDIPVVFHCMSFIDAQGRLQPPYWNPQRDAAHLIDVTNQMYKGTGISFRLKEVRTDPRQYPYLLTSGTVDDWHRCAPSEQGWDAAVKCLQGPADNSDATLAVNVIIAGSRVTFCDTPERQPACGGLFLGYCNAAGPWMGDPAAGLASSTWSEANNPRENWIHMLYEYFSGDLNNRAAVWDGGAATLAHELGHYLGLRHTHNEDCGGDGIAATDAVPDTPMNQDISGWYGDDLSGKLGAFCSNWRNGNPVDRTLLTRFNSCGQRATPAAIDNVFNIMSYLPDQCCMLFTDNQVARLQWAIATFRPQMMARYAA